MRNKVLRVVGFVLWLVLSMLANPVAADSTVSKFAQCTKQCLVENENCKKEQQAKCKQGDESCLEVCNIAYPDCVANCPRPGSQ